MTNAIPNKCIAYFIEATVSQPGLTRATLAKGSAFLVGAPFCVRCPSDQPPNNDAEQRTDKSRDQVLERDLDLAEAEIDVEQPEEESAYHSDAHVSPKAKSSLTKCHQTSGQRSSPRSDN